MKIAFVSATAWMAAMVIVSAPMAIAQSTVQSPGAGNTAVLKAKQCAEMQRRIAAHKAASSKGQKAPGDETIKKDIVWYQANCN